MPDERTDALHPIKILTRWTRGKIIIIVCLVAPKISWRFHHLTINPIIEIDEIPTFSFYTIAVLTNSQSSNKARALRSSLELGVFQQSKVGRLLKVVVVRLGMSSVTASKVILLVHQIVHFPAKLWEWKERYQNTFFRILTASDHISVITDQRLTKTLSI